MKLHIVVSKARKYLLVDWNDGNYWKQVKIPIDDYYEAKRK